VPNLHLETLKSILFLNLGLYVFSEFCMETKKLLLKFMPLFCTLFFAARRSHPNPYWQKPAYVS
jgi:hypothetical protein